LRFARESLLFSARMSDPSRSSSVPDWILENFAGAPFGVLVFDGAERVAYLNPVQEKNSGARAEDLVGRPAREVYGRAIEQFEPEYRALLEDGRPFRKTFRNYRRALDDRLISFSLGGYRIREWVVFVTVVEEELREETARADALAAEVRIVRALLELADLLVTPTKPAAVLESFVRLAPRMIDAGRASISLWNEAHQRHEAAAHFGLTAEEVRLFGEFPLDDEPFVPMMRGADREILIEDASRSDLCSPALAAAFRVGMLLFVPLRWRDRYLGFLAIDRKQFAPRDLELVRGAARLLAAALANTLLLDEALQASRLKSAFLANVSHELRTPLNVILGYASLIGDHLEETGDDSQKPLFDAIHRASRRLLRTINTILDFSRLETGTYPIDPRPLAIAPLLSEIVREAAPEARRKGIDLRLAVDRPEAMIAFDEHCLRELVGQILDNAVKFTERGEVEVRLGEDAAGRLSISVRDTGIGIDPAYLPQLFQPFSQEDAGAARRYEGNGLGLALARKFAERNEAEIEVESAKGEGSTFRLVFRGLAPPPRAAA
jgi:signal transduction histidine kinase